MTRGGSTRDRWWLPSWRGAVVLLLFGLVINLGVAVAIARWGVEPMARGLWKSLNAMMTGPAEGNSGEDFELVADFWTRSLPTPRTWPGPVPESWKSTPMELAESLDWQSPRTLESDEIELEASINWAIGWLTEAVSVTGPTESPEMPIRHLWLYSVHRIGFPVATLRFDERKDSQSGVIPIEVSRLHDGFRFHDPRFTPGQMHLWTLPIMPVWPGIVLNSVLYAFVVWLSWMPLQALRRRSRLRRGECVRCRYPIVPGKQVCSECGTPSAPSTGIAGAATKDPAA